MNLADMIEAFGWIDAKFAWTFYFFRGAINNQNQKDWLQ